MKKRDAAKTKRNILTAAEAVFSEKGFHGSRIDEIARLAEANKKLIYDQFDSKQELYRAVFVYVYSRLAAEEKAVLRSTAGEVSAVSKIVNIISLYFDYLQTNPNYIKLLMQENLQKGVNIGSFDMSEPRAEAIGLLKEVLACGITEGVFRKEANIEQSIIALLMFTFSYYSNRYTLSKMLQCDMFDPQFLEEERKYFTEFFLRYLCVPEVLAHMDMESLLCGRRQTAVSEPTEAIQA